MKSWQSLTSHDWEIVIYLCLFSSLINTDCSTSFPSCCKVTHKRNPAYFWQVLLYSAPAPQAQLLWSCHMGEIFQMDWMHTGHKRTFPYKRTLKSLRKHGDNGMTDHTNSCLSCSFNHLKLAFMNLNIPKKAVEQFEQHPSRQSKRRLKKKRYLNVHTYI